MIIDHPRYAPLMRTVFMIVLWLALVLVCNAKELQVNDEEQRNIAVICRVAAKSPLIDDDMTAQIAQFCVAWRARMLAPEPPKAKDDQK